MAVVDFADLADLADFADVDLAAVRRVAVADLARAVRDAVPVDDADLVRVVLVARVTDTVALACAVLDCADADSADAVSTVDDALVIRNSFVSGGYRIDLAMGCVDPRSCVILQPIMSNRFDINDTTTSRRNESLSSYFLTDNQPIRPTKSAACPLKHKNT